MDIFENFVPPNIFDSLRAWGGSKRAFWVIYLPPQFLLPSFLEGIFSTSRGWSGTDTWGARGGGGACPQMSNWGGGTKGEVAPKFFGKFEQNDK